MPTCSSRTDYTRDCITGSSRLPISWQPRLSLRGGTQHGHDTGLLPPRPHFESPAQDERLRGVPENGRHLGAPSPLRSLRPRRLLRLLEEQARDQALSRYGTPGDQVARARRELDVLLSGRRDVRARLSRPASDQHAAVAAYIEGAGKEARLLQQ